MSARDRLQRRVLPRLVVGLSTVDRPARTVAAVRRRLGGRGAVRLFFAFDDAASAVALDGLARRLEGREVDLHVEAVVARGIPGDPAADAKRAFAVPDARRLVARDGLTLSRTAPLAPEDVAFLAEWTGEAAPREARTAFALAAIRELWFASDGPVDRAPFVALWERHVGGTPPADGADGRVASERRMRRRRLYDTPVAVVGHRWWFAHERLPQIAGRLDELGWRASA